jgi:hypothetical protein
MAELDCGDCTEPLVSIVSTAPDTGPYPTAFLSCPACGSAWEQGSDGELTKKRTRVDPPVLG